MAFLLSFAILCSLVACAKQGPAESSAPESRSSSAVSGGASEREPSSGGGSSAASAIPSAPESSSPESSSASSGTETLSELRALGGEQGAVCCVAFLGYVEHGKTMEDLLFSSELQELFASYPFLWEIPEERRIVNPSGGGEVYCVVPVSPVASLTVCPWIYDFEETSSFEGARGEALYTGGAEPVLIQGNVSDILPDLEVALESGEGDALRYQPYTSLKDGSLGVPEDGTVYDFTEYRYPIEEE